MARSSFASNGAEGDTNATGGGICDGGLAPTLGASVRLAPAVSVCRGAALFDGACPSSRSARRRSDEPRDPAGSFMKGSEGVRFQQSLGVLDMFADRYDLAVST